MDLNLSGAVNSSAVMGPVYDGENFGFPFVAQPHQATPASGTIDPVLQFTVSYEP
jgi:hypothetical protein